MQGRTNLHNKGKANATRIPCRKCGGNEMKVIDLIRRELQGAP